jgi:hypothetical protein
MTSTPRTEPGKPPVSKPAEVNPQPLPDLDLSDDEPAPEAEKPAEAPAPRPIPPVLAARKAKTLPEAAPEAEKPWPFEHLAKWHSALGWLLCLPAGCVATALIQGLIHLLWLWDYSVYDFWCPFWIGQHIAQAAEPFAFLAAALWVLPKFHRTFTLLFAVAYCGFELFLVVRMAERLGSSWLPATALASGICTAIYYVRHYTKADDAA